MSKYRVSKLAHTYEKNGVLALFHSLTYETIFTGLEAKELLRAFAHSSTIGDALSKLPLNIRKDADLAIKDLIDNNLLVPVDVDEYEEIRLLSKTLVGYPEISILYLLLTGQCNMRCSYCFVETPRIATSYKSAMMSKETAILGIDTYSKAIAANTRNKLITRNVYYYGGEPLLNWDVLKYSAEYMIHLKENGGLPEQLVINLVTNGTLVTRKIGLNAHF